MPSARNCAMVSGRPQRGSRRLLSMRSACAVADMRWPATWWCWCWCGAEPGEWPPGVPTAPWGCGGGQNTRP